MVKRRGGGKATAAGVLHDLPEPAEGQLVAEVTAMQSSAQITVRKPDGESVLCELPARFRNKVFVRRGIFVIISEAAGASSGKVRGCVDHVLFGQQVKHLKKNGMWPAAFEAPVDLPDADADADAGNASEGEGESESDDDDDLLPNPNRRPLDDDSDDYDEDD